VTTQESYGKVMVIYTGQNGAPNITKTFTDEHELRGNLIFLMQSHEVLSLLHARMTQMSVAEVGQLEEAVQREWDRRARERIKAAAS
jgi:hypothetical protein